MKLYGRLHIIMSSDLAEFGDYFDASFDITPMIVGEFKHKKIIEYIRGHFVVLHT